MVVESPQDLEFDILELKEDRSEWSVRFHVNLNPLRAPFRHSNLDIAHMVGLFYIFCVVRQEKEEESMLVFFMDGRVMAYNLVDHSLRELSRFGPFLKGGSRFDVFHYYENLSRVGPSNAC